jgi:beta-glucosidase/6-phospho-beta-glucosidase/beta-galactosidase
VDATCETGAVSDRPLVLATLEGYSVEGGFDRSHEPATCYVPTIALGRHDGPGDAQGLWSDYERVIDLAAEIGLGGLRINVEWARVEPRREEVDASALERYADVVAHARQLGLHVTVAVVDAVWPSWLGMEAWLLPWVVPHVIAQARRVVNHIGDDGVRMVVFTNPDELVTSGYLNEMAPPWRRGASDDAASARTQIDEILRQLRDDPLVGPRMVGSTQTIDLDMSAEEITRVRHTVHECDEMYLRSLVRGNGPTAAPAGLLEQQNGEWSVRVAPEVLRAIL